MSLPTRNLSTRIPITSLRTFVVAAADRLGVSPEHIPLFCEALLEADLRGISSHGIFRLPMYGRGIQAGAINPCPELHTVRDRGTISVVDADKGLGIVVGQLAMARAISRAEELGVGIVAVRNSNHAGILAIHVEPAIHRNMLGYFVSNAPAMMAPWGGKQALLSNGPFAWGIPSNHQPIIVDMACSSVARGRIRIAAETGEPIPEGWAMDVDGRPTEDALAAMNGLVLPMAAHKGSALAILAEVLAAILPGANLSMDVSRAFLAHDARELDYWGVGHLAIAFNIDFFMDIADFLERVDALIVAVKGSQRARTTEDILLPGEPELRERTINLELGVAVRENILQLLAEYAEEIGIDSVTL